MSRLGLGVGFGVGGGNGFGFSPLSLSPLLWLRADLGITIATGVSAWNDQSGTGDANKNVLQATAGKQPTLNASDAGFNGKPTLSFNGTTHALVGGTWAVALAQPSTWYIVGKTTGSAVTQLLLDSASGGIDQQIGVQADGKSPRMFAGSLINGTGDWSVKNVGCAVFNGASSAFYMSAPTTATFTGNAGAQSMSGTSIGSGVGGGSSFLAGTIAEVLAFGSAHSPSQRSQVMAYFGLRYAITIGP